MSMTQWGAVRTLALTLTLVWSCAPGQTKQEAAIASARQALADEIGVVVDDIEVVEFEDVVWGDASLGCPEPGMTYSRAVESGYRIVLAAADETYDFHGSDHRGPFLCRPETLENGSFTAELDGVEIHYEVHGKGPVVMAVPVSWGLDIGGLRGLLGGLEKKLTMVYFDPRGIGGSSGVRDAADMSMEAVRQDFDHLRAYLGLDQVNAIGWSNGAANLILLAAEHPETLSSAIFVHGVASFTREDGAEFAKKFPQLTQAQMAFIQEMADESLTDAMRTERFKELWLTQFFPSQVADPESGHELIAEAFGGAEFSYAHGSYANQESMGGFDTREQLPGIPVRSLVIAGRYDMSPPEKVKVLADGLPDSVYVLFENSGHFSPIEEPELFEKTVFGFLGVD